MMIRNIISERDSKNKNGAQNLGTLVYRLIKKNMLFYFVDLSQSLSGLTVSTVTSTQSSQVASNESCSFSTLKRLSMSSDDSFDQPNFEKIDIMTPELAAALDRTGTSSRNATFILAAAASSLGHNVNEINLSHSTIHKSRKKLRSNIVRKLKKDLHVAQFLVLHWDGKLLPNNERSGKIERLPIVVTGLNTEQLLGVPKLDSGSGMNSAKAITEMLTEWNLSDRVIALCFDTTASNTGNKTIL